MPNIINRSDAREKGLRFFCTGRPCKNGHLAERTVSEGKCFDCVKIGWEKVRRRKGMKPFQPNEARRAAKAAGENIYIGKPCKKGHAGKRWTHNSVCFECCKLASLAYSKSNNYRHQKAWMAENKHLDPIYKKRYRSTENGRLQERVNRAVRRARIRKAGGQFSREDILIRFKAQRGRCAWCATSIKKKYHIDHILSVARGGSNDPRNIQLLCPSCNLRKWSHDAVDFARMEGRLL